MPPLHGVENMQKRFVNINSFMNLISITTNYIPLYITDRKRGIIRCLSDDQTMVNAD